ncbi:MAG: hypothetical protein ABIQ00_24840 [Chitinophagaceae bacterium]
MKSPCIPGISAEARKRFLIQALNSASLKLKQKILFPQTNFSLHPTHLTNDKDELLYAFIKDTHLQVLH